MIACWAFSVQGRGGEVVIGLGWIGNSCFGRASGGQVVVCGSCRPEVMVPLDVLLPSFEHPLSILWTSFGLQLYLDCIPVPVHCTDTLR